MKIATGSCDELQLLVAGFCILRVWVVRRYFGGVRVEDDFGPAIVAIVEVFVAIRG
jgi:hypothetical protein